jgi:hypothetical protein
MSLLIAAADNISARNKSGRMEGSEHQEHGP